MINNKKQTAQKHPEPTTPKGLNKIEGILTSALQIRHEPHINKVYCYGFFQLEGIDTDIKNLLQSKRTLWTKDLPDVNALDIPVIFKLANSENPEQNQPNIPPRAKVLLEGHWAQPTDSNRPSFTCLAWEIVSVPPITIKDLQKQISSLLTTSLTKKKEWAERTEYLFRKRKDLEEIEKLSKLGEEYLSAYLLLRQAHYSNYQDKLLALNQFNQPEYLTKIAQEIEEVAQHIRAYEAVSKKNSSSDLPLVNTDYESKDPLKDLKRQNQDLDYLITSGKSELRKELRILQGKLRNCKCGANSKAI